MENNTVIEKLLNPYIKLVNAWTDALNHVDEIIKTNPDPELIEKRNRLNSSIEKMNNKINYFKQLYSDNT